MGFILSKIRNVDEYTAEEVATHNTASSLWLILEGNVLDLTNFVNSHPGGDQILLDIGGTDGTLRFYDIQHSRDAKAIANDYVIGRLKGAEVKSLVGKSFKGHLMIASTIGFAILAAYIIARRVHNK